MVLCCLTVITRYAFLKKEQEATTKFETASLPPSSIQHAELKYRKTHIGLLKVHKAASTTLQNIIIRFGLAMNLTFVLPTKKSPPQYSHVISILNSLTASDIEPSPQGKNFDILCHHVIYNKQAWDAVLPGNTVIIGSVREPTSHFRSVLKYFRPHYIKSIMTPNKVETFLQNPYKYETTVPYSITNNRMSFEFGVNETIILNHDVSAFNRYLNDVLDKHFDLVVVMERFDESLVLMKRKLNWTLSDIVYVPRNSHFSLHPDLMFHDDLIPLLMKHNKLDSLLYDFFRRKLEDQISAEREKEFDEEVNAFINIRKRVVNFCRSKAEWGRSIKFDATPWSTPFKWTRVDCELLMLKEKTITEIVRQRQYPTDKAESNHIAS